MQLSVCGGSIFYAAIGLQRGVFKMIMCLLMIGGSRGEGILSLLLVYVGGMFKMIMGLLMVGGCSEGGVLSSLLIGDLSLLLIGGGGVEGDFESGQAVGAGGEREAAAVFVEDFADEKQADAVAVDFGGEEGAEEHAGGGVGDAGTVVGHG